MPDIEKEKLNELKRINRNLEALTKAVSKLSTTATTVTQIFSGLEDRGLEDASPSLDLDTPEYDTPK